MLLRLAKQITFLQNLYITLSTAIPPLVKHNAGKIEILKCAFWHVAMEKVEGSYFEFGVYEGSSMLSALKIHKSVSSPETAQFLGAQYRRNFYGFDSFESGFRYNSEDEEHPVFREGEFVSSFERCRQRLKKFPDVKLVKGYFEDTIQGRMPPAIPAGEKCAVAFFDCDLKMSTAIALDFLKPLLQLGSVIILDDVYSYKGDPALGVNGAWVEFLAANPSVKTREFFNYGCTGKSYIVYAL